jgi:hypothetical protein
MFCTPQNLPFDFALPSGYLAHAANCPLLGEK